MAILIGLLASYVTGSAFALEKNTRAWIGEALLVLAAAWGFIDYGWLGFIYLIGLALATLLAWFIMFYQRMRRAVRGIETETAKSAALDETIKAQAGGDPEIETAIRKNLEGQSYRSGKAETVQNWSNKETYTVSTIERTSENPLEYNGSSYNSFTESAVFPGTNANKAAMVQLDYLGGMDRDVKPLHKLVTNAVSNAQISSLLDPEWWTEILKSADFTAEATFEPHPMYDGDTLMVTMVKA